MRLIAPLMLLIAAMGADSAYAQDLRCFAQASSRYHIPVGLLRAISHVESGGNPRAVHINKNGTKDIGHMQINTTWLPTLAKFGISEQSLFDPCTNTQVGAWVLANNFSTMGYDWRAVDAYNTSKPVRSSAYTRKVASILQLQSRKETQID